MPLRYFIPQFIEIEDKVIGPFTLKQFLYLLAGGIITYLLYNSLWQISPFLFILCDLPILIISFTFVFVKINERPFAFFLLTAIYYFFSETERIWISLEELEDIIIKPSIEEIKVLPTKAEKPKEEIIKSKLEELALLVDTKGWKDIETKEEFKGRIVSSSEETMSLKVTLPQEKELEDIFEKFEK